MNKSAMFSMELFSKHLSPSPSSVKLQVQCTTCQNQLKVWIQHFWTHFTCQTQLTGGFSVLVLNLLPYYLTRIVYEGDNKYRKKSIVFGVFICCRSGLHPSILMRSLKCEYKTIIQILLLFIVQAHYFFCWRVVGDILKVSLFYGIS